MPIPRPLGKYALSTTNQVWFLVPAGEGSSTCGKLERKSPCDLRPVGMSPKVASITLIICFMPTNGVGLL
jgi:hypothetical protein